MRCEADVSEKEHRGDQDASESCLRPGRKEGCGREIESKLRMYACRLSLRDGYI